MSPDDDSSCRTPDRPPRTDNPKDEPRRVGVEIEYAGLSVEQSADLVQEQFGGERDAESAHRIAVNDTRFGDFMIELDAQMIHADEDNDDPAKKLKKETLEVVGHAVAGVVPIEIVCPPIAWSELGAVDALFDAMRAAGAKGTDEGVLYGFGLHLNPEVAEETTDYALRHLRAFIILEEGLRERIGIDPMRRVLPHIEPFPETYARRIMDADYAPDMAGLIADYLAGNPTRNRGLDMTPLFRHVDEGALLKGIPDASLIKSRPTFHYRLPNSLLSDPDWGAVSEWNRWLRVEALAADGDALASAMADFAGRLDQPFYERWMERVRGWLG